MRTLSLSLPSLVWSMLLTSCIIIVGGVWMAQLLSGFMEDDASSADHRQWAYNRFGGSSRAIYTMFEATFTGSWHLSTRPLLDNVSPSYAVFWVLYVVCINFALMRVIAALFLKQTMMVAGQ